MYCSDIKCNCHDTPPRFPRTAYVSSGKNKKTLTTNANCNHSESFTDSKISIFTIQLEWTLLKRSKSTYIRCVWERGWVQNNELLVVTTLRSMYSAMMFKMNTRARITVLACAVLLVLQCSFCYGQICKLLSFLYI